MQIRSGEFFVHIKYPYLTTRFWHLSIEKYKLNVDMCVLHSRKLACDSFSWNQCYICQQTGTSVHRVLPKTAGHGPCHCWSYNHGEYIIKKRNTSIYVNRFWHFQFWFICLMFMQEIHFSEINKTWKEKPAMHLEYYQGL